MKNKVQLITYSDRFGGKGIDGIHSFLNTHFTGVFDGGVHLLPFYYPIDGADAGYDPIDHCAVDQSVGTWADVKKLAGDYNIMADMIVNHTSVNSREFNDVKKKGKQSEYFDMFLTKEKIFGENAPKEQTGKIYRPRPTSPFTTIKLINGEEYNFWTTFTSDQLDIDVEHPKGNEYLNNILNIFHENGIKMIRLDAAGYAIKKAGTSCFMLPETYAFIEGLASNAKARGMEVLVEIHAHYKEQLEIAKKVDFVYDFALPPLVLHTIYSQSTSQLKRWLDISPRNAVTVLDTHDGIGVVDAAGKGDEKGLLEDHEIDALVEGIHHKSGGDSRKATGKAASNLDLYQVNCTFYDALGKDDFDYLMARAIQFFSPGVPQVYYMGLLAGENDMDLLEKSKIGRDINRRYYTEEEIEKSLNREVVKSLIDLIKFRNNHISFTGDFKVVDCNDHQLILVWQAYGDWSRLFVDLSGREVEITYSDGEETKVLEFLHLKQEPHQRV